MSYGIDSSYWAVILSQLLKFKSLFNLVSNIDCKTKT